MPGECWKKVQYIRTGCFQNRQNAPSTGIFYLLWNNLHWQCSFQGTVDLEHCKTTMPFAFCPWTFWMRNCKFHQLMFSALTNIQVSNSLCLDGPSLGWNSFDFHLLVISHYVCFVMFFPIYWQHWHLRLLHWVSPGLRRRHLEYHLKVSITHIAKTITTTKIELSGQNKVAKWGGL